MHTTGSTAASNERITTRCPACGCQTLFIGSGGHLVCSLIDCPSPGVERTIARLQWKAERYDAIALFFPPATGQPSPTNAVDPQVQPHGQPTPRDNAFQPPGPNY